MSHIFISYSSKDAAFANRLADDLSRYSKVWIDHEGIKAGVEWENALEKAIRECGVFLIVVSPDSNRSEWVARETILAEHLQKQRIPLLIEGELPLRLLNVQYVDFRGNYEGGFTDLLESLQVSITPEHGLQEEVNKLLGAGIQAHLLGKTQDANGLISQALTLQPAIAASLEDFWHKLQQVEPTALAPRYMAQIKTRERSKYYGKLPELQNNLDYYTFQISLDAPRDALDKIDFVKYILHESFNRPFQIVRDRESNFAWGGRVWGTFDTPIEVHFLDGSVGKISHDLTLDEALSRSP